MHKHVQFYVDFLEKNFEDIDFSRRLRLFAPCASLGACGFSIVGTSF